MKMQRVHVKVEMQQNTGNDKAFVISCLPLLECVSVEKRTVFLYLCREIVEKYFKKILNRRQHRRNVQNSYF